MNDFYVLWKSLVLTLKLARKDLFTPLTSTSFVGRALIHLPTCHSTNDYALDIIKSGTPENGQVIIASEQTSGRGQRGNKWYTEPGKNLTFSIIVDCGYLKPMEIFKLNMGVSLGIISLSEMLDLKSEMTENNSFNSQFSIPNSQLKIKWPNDIYYVDQKLGGILIETVIRGNESFWAVVGIGLNVNQSDFQYLNAISLKKILGRELDLQSVLQHLLTGIENMMLLLKTQASDTIKKEYLSSLYKFGQKVLFKSGEKIFEGKIDDVSNAGELGVRISNEIQYFKLKEITFVK